MPCDFSAVCGVNESSHRGHSNVTLSQPLWHKLLTPLRSGSGRLPLCPQRAQRRAMPETGGWRSSPARTHQLFHHSSSITASNGELFVRTHKSLCCISPDQTIPSRVRHTSNTINGKSWRILAGTLTFTHKFPRECQNIFPIIGKGLSPCGTISFT